MPHYGADGFEIVQADLDGHLADLEKYKVDGISNEARDYFKSALWSKMREPLFDWWQPLEKAIPSPEDMNANRMQQHCHKLLGEWKKKTKELYLEACKAIKLPEEYRHGFSIIPETNYIYDPPSHVEKKGTVMIVLSSGFNKAWDKHGNFDLKLGEKIYTMKFLLSAVDTYNVTDPDKVCPYSFCFVEADAFQGCALTNSKPWSTPKPGSQCEYFAKVVVKLQIAATQPVVLCLHSQPARNMFYFKEGEIGFSGLAKHRAKFQDDKSNDLVPFNIFIEAFNHPASAKDSWLQARKWLHGPNRTVRGASASMQIVHRRRRVRDTSLKV